MVNFPTLQSEKQETNLPLAEMTNFHYVKATIEEVLKINQIWSYFYQLIAFESCPICGKKPGFFPFGQSGFYLFGQGYSWTLTILLITDCQAKVMFSQACAVLFTISLMDAQSGRSSLLATRSLCGQNVSYWNALLLLKEIIGG